MKILFIGCVESSYKLIETLLKNGKEVVGVISKGRSDFNADFVNLHPLCEEYSVPVRNVKNINDEDSIAFIKECNADIGYCFGWSQLIEPYVIKLFPKGMVGFHPAELPKNRGRHPIIWALALGLSETASTFFMISAGADEGDIISQKKVTIEYEDDARTLYDKVMDTAVKQVLEFTDDFERGHIKSVQQKSSDGNSWRKRSKADGQIDWRMSSRSIYNLVRSLTKPYVGAHFVYDGHDFKVWKIREVGFGGMENIEPGKVLEKNSDGTIDVKVSDGIVRLIDFDRIDIDKGDYIL